MSQKKVFDLYAGAMLGCAVRITGNKEDAKDITQEAFIDAFTKIEMFAGQGSFEGWLKRITINKSLNYVKRQRQFFQDLSEIHIEEDSSAEPEYTIEMVKSALEQLSPGFRTVFSLYAFEDYSHKEIADALDISESTSKTQYKRAKQRIKEIILNNTQYG